MCVGGGGRIKHRMGEGIKKKKGNINVDKLQDE